MNLVSGLLLKVILHQKEQPNPVSIQNACSQLLAGVFAFQETVESSPGTKVVCSIPMTLEAYTMSV